MPQVPKTAKLLFLFIILFFNNSYARQDGVSIYLHPVGFLAAFPFGYYPIFLTAEVPLSSANSLIIRPSLCSSKNNNFVDNDRIFRLGSDLGIRKYFFPRDFNTNYLQWQIGLFYYSDLRYKNKTIWLDAMGYWGLSFENANLDMGFGIVCIKGNNRISGDGGCTGHIDMNLAFKLPF
ncbi:MAG: hypothetical protein FWB90_05425 [Fibromonadales bacterium]|nr:hypothetical protein [Fibromonadales bacterium]